MKQACSRMWRTVKVLLITFGVVLLIHLILAFTSAPFWIWYGMGTKKAGINRPPEYIVVLGGGGMPSESGLMRCWYAAKAGNYFVHSKIIIALPGDTTDSLSSVRGMENELILRGIGADRIMYEDSGANTRAQAINIRRMTSSPANPLGPAILLVTSPEHLYRATLAFRKAGFRKVDGLPAFEQEIETDITFQGKQLGGRKWIPDVGENITIRYRFWTQMHYEMLIMREWAALGYYWLKGWV
ncbi:MAG TPA: YdcF family protein [Bacteroidales bacterium]|nr:YdcF family protein [Bacteroidales bacterium]